MHEDDLTLSLEDLARLLTGENSLDRTLTRVATLAVQAIPGAQGAGLTLLQQDRPQTVIATDAFVHQVDEVQYGLGEGPCLSAVAAGRTFTSGNLGGEPMWPRFGPRVGRLGVHSALSLPLLVNDKPIGALNVYARPHDSFGPAATRMGEAFAAPAAVSVANARALAQAERLVAQLSDALQSRTEIDQALGIVMSRTGGTSEQAFRQLRKQSQTRQVKVVDLAGELIADAVARARLHRRTTFPEQQVQP